MLSEQGRHHSAGYALKNGHSIYMAQCATWTALLTDQAVYDEKLFLSFADSDRTVMSRTGLSANEGALLGFGTART